MFTLFTALLCAFRLVTFIRQPALQPYNEVLAPFLLTGGLASMVLYLAYPIEVINPGWLNLKRGLALPGSWDAAYMKGTTEDAIKAATVTFTATAGGKIYTATKPGYKFLSGKYYAATLTMAPTGALAGKFTINGSGDQVYFSQGNLQATYNGSSWSWAFATNQWDYIGNAAGNTSVNGDGIVSASNVTVDLFGWVGASSDWTGAAQYGISNSKTNNSKATYGNVANEALKSDWGNTIGSGWRTLTSDEWTYLFNTRTVNGGTGNGKSYTLGQSVNGKVGIVIYPDNYTGSVYSGKDWASFEAAGCVFLPAAGSRNGAELVNAGSYGYYWSSSPNASDVKYAYRVNFYSNILSPAENGNRYRGYSVRLVRPVE